MKKKLFLIPMLAGLMLCSCDPNAGGNGGFDYDDGDDFVAQTDLFNDGDEGLLSIRFSNIYAKIQPSTGYTKVATVTQLGNYTVGFSNVCINRLCSTSQPAWTTPNNNYANVVQFKAQSGEVTVENIKATKVTVYSFTSYDYRTDDWWVTFNGTTIAAPSTAETETLDGFMSGTETTYQGYLEKVVFNVNATSAGALKFGNTKTNKGARFARKIVIE